jgi:hypothetical protein
VLLKDFASVEERTGSGKGKKWPIVYPKIKLKKYSGRRRRRLPVEEVVQ